MLFNSAAFLLFFPVVVLAYFWVPAKVKNLWLLLCSYYFYMFQDPAFSLVLLFVTIASFVASHLYGRTATPATRKATLIVSVVLCLLPLLTFKYLPFANHLLGRILGAAGVRFSIFPAGATLPTITGASFFTFTSLGYAFDVYRHKYPPERNFITYALFVSFFPSVLSGPIERGDNLLVQLRTPQVFQYQRVADGLFTMLLGFFKKMVLADSLALLVNPVYAKPAAYSGSGLLLATAMFGLQLYCDFSGYSDMALGAAAVFGFKLRPNFLQPYLSTSIKDFWARWHISLSTWFRDYLYIPLGGNRGGQNKTLRNLLITFVVSGLWHGANLTYLFWGLLHGLYSAAGRITAPYRAALRRRFPQKSAAALFAAAGFIFTFSLVTLAWVFFRANTLYDAFFILSRIFWQRQNFAESFSALTAVYTKSLPLLGMGLLALLAFDVWQRGRPEKPIAALVRTKRFFVRWPIYYALVLLILYLGNFGKSSGIYFQY